MSKLTRTFPVIYTEPPAGSIVMTEGDTGTAHQRFYSDGLWHSTTGKARTWEALLALTERPGAYPLGLVYAAPADEPSDAGSTQLALFDEHGEPTLDALPLCPECRGRGVQHKMDCTQRRIG